MKALFTILTQKLKGKGLLLPFYFFAFLLFVACASMGNPDGGWYDDTPPRVVKSTPADMGTDVSHKRVSIYFNEYIKLEDAQSKVVISPPQMEMPEIKATGKRIVIDLKDSLKANTTYTIDFSDAISDNNEGNPMGNYAFTFSTGSVIDTLQVSGYVLNASNLEPVKGIMVGLYEADSVVDSTFHTKPMQRVARTNGSGYFIIKGIAPGSYRVFALNDADGDYIYGQKSEMLAFNHDTIIPSANLDMRQDTVWRDPLHIDRIQQTSYTHFLPDDITLLCFQAPQTDRFFVKSERKEPEKIGLFFTYGHDSLPQLQPLNFYEEHPELQERAQQPTDSLFVIEASEHRDTVYYWLRDTMLVNQDTLRFAINYMMTDSTGVLVAKTDTIESLVKVPYAKRLKNKLKDAEKWQRAQDKKKKRGEPYDSIMKPEPMEVKIMVSNMMSPMDNVWFEMPAPLTQCDSSAIHLYSMIDSLWYEAPFVFEQTTPRTYVLKAEWREGTEYSLEIDTLAFTTIYGQQSDPIKKGLKVKTVDDYSTLMLNISGVSDTATVVVQMLDGSDKFIRQTIVNDGTAEFYYVKPGKYYLKAFEDWNHNGIWDTGDYDKDLQAEPVYYFPEELECKVKWDVSRDWNLTARKRFQQKPAAITKQKPDQQKQLRNRNAQRAADKGVPLPPEK